MATVPHGDVEGNTGIETGFCKAIIRDMYIAHPVEGKWIRNNRPVIPRKIRVTNRP